METCVKLERFELERWMTAWELDVDYDIAESGIYPLSLADLYDLIGPAEAASLDETIRTLRLGYSEARGTLALRSAIAMTFERATPDDVLITTGAIEANFLVFNALLNEGDHVVAVSPAYQQLLSVPKAITTNVSECSVVQGEGFRYDLDHLESLIQPNTKLIVINSPHNPTGAMLTQTDLARVVEIAARSGAWILSDEAYRWLEHPGGEKLPSPAHDLGERIISVGTMSKPFGLPGLRVGWLVANPEIVAACWGLRDYVSLSPAGISDAIARVAIEQRERIWPRNNQIIQQNMETATAWFRKNADIVTWQPPRAGLLAMLRYQHDIPSLELADRLAKEARVMLAPGSAFGLEHHLRIGVGQRPDLFAEGLRLTAEFLRAL
jgi:aspartate/methionine/tyrosine aminotransferase